MGNKNLKSALHDLKSNHLHRKRKTTQSPQAAHIRLNGQTVLNFTSNDYLSLANHPKIIEATRFGLQKYGLGSGASHLISGHSEVHETLETNLAKFFGTARSLLFSSGYMANIGVLDALLERDDVLLQDKLNHASLMDAGRLSNAKHKRYRHNDMAHLTNLLTSEPNASLIASDGVFSMDGDCAEINRLVQIGKASNAQVFIDEAHSFGVLGNHGKGLCANFSKPDKPIIMATFGKALGTVGACVAGSDDLIEYLIQKSRPYIYTTALPPALAYASIEALHLLKSADDKRAHLQTLINYLRQQIMSIGFHMPPSDTPIQPIFICDNRRVLEISEYLLMNNILLQAIRPPTVPKGTARLRVTLCADHQLTDIDYLTEVLAKA